MKCKSKYPIRIKGRREVKSNDRSYFLDEPNRFSLYVFEAISGVFFRYERLCFGVGILNHQSFESRCLSLPGNKKRRVSTTLLSCSEVAFMLDCGQLLFRNILLEFQLFNSLLIDFPPVFNIKGCLPVVSSLWGLTF